MADEIGKWIIILFGIFFMLVGLLMLFNPEKARLILRKAGSTNLINYGEITIRMIPAIGFILCAEESKFPVIFKLVGWFMIGTSFLLYLVPKKLHHDFSNSCADFLKPIYFQIIAPFSIAIGVLILYSLN